MFQTLKGKHVNWVKVILESNRVLRCRSLSRCTQTTLLNQSNVSHERNCPELILLFATKLLGNYESCHFRNQDDNTIN